MDVVLVDHRTPELAARALKGLAGGPVARRTVVRTEGRKGPVPAGVELLTLPDNPGFGFACNRGADRGRAPWILFLNPDCFPSGADLQELLSRALSIPRLGAVGPGLVDEKGLLLRGGGRDLACFARLFDSERPRRGLTEVDWVAGTCSLIRREAWEQVGGFDESYFLYCEDVDLCRRLRRRGWGVALTGSLRVTHLGGASFEDSESRYAVYRRARGQYMRRHGNPVVRLSWWAMQGWKTMQRWRAA